FVFAEVDAAHAAGADGAQDFVAAQGQTAPLALEQLLGLEGGQYAVAHHVIGELCGVSGQNVAAGRLLEVLVERFLVQQGAAEEQGDKLLGVGRRWHRGFPDERQTGPSVTDPPNNPSPDGAQTPQRRQRRASPRPYCGAKTSQPQLILCSALRRRIK